MKKRQKLELTWIGKEDQPKLEPRILIEDPEKSYGDPNSENMLIYGDNLLSLKALEQDFAGRINCIYIDPPFNTGQAFEHYDDGLEHSIWLSLLRNRIDILHRLLAPTGSFFVHIDDNELGYLLAITDEIFGRNNRISIITFKQSSASGPKAINPGLVTTTNFIIYYVKNKSEWKPNRVYTPILRDGRYSKFIINKKDPHDVWKLINLKEAFLNSYKIKSWNHAKAKYTDKLEEKLSNFVHENAECVVRTARVAPKDVNELARTALKQSAKSLGVVQRSRRTDRDDYFFLNGEQLIFYHRKTKNIDGIVTTASPLTNLWDDILSNNLHNEGGVRFPNGKKPEGLIKRCLELATDPGDLVLDSFSGSGTTGAVAHKMGRRWIMVELGEHCHTHCLPRLKRVADGTDQSGISKAVGWKGGGGFKYFYLAPTLLKKDRYENWVIDERYNADMLAAAMAKHEGFRYSPDEQVYWKQGQSTEKDFIFTTTQIVTAELTDKIRAEMQPDESLLICCKTFQKECEDRHPHITVRKIPGMLLGRCEFGMDDYSLNVITMPEDPDAPEFVPVGPQQTDSKPKRKKEKLKQYKQKKLF